MDKRKLAAVILLDLRKAFDSINHERLLQKISYLDTSPASVEWLRVTYQIGFRQSASTPYCQILYRYLMGYLRALFSRLLYIPQRPSYVPDVCIWVLCWWLKTLSVITCVEGAIQKLQSDLHGVAAWDCENELLINPDKTTFLIIDTRQQLSKLEPTPSLSFLGKLLNSVP